MIGSGGAVELPDDDGGVEVRPGARRGQHVVLKPSDTTPASDGAAWRSSSPTPAARRVQRRLRRPGHRRGAHRAPDAGDGLDHRLASGRARRWPRRRPATVKRTHLELGGKAPVVVFEDADLAAAAEGIAVGGLLQRGPGLHGRHPCARRRAHPRRLRRGARRAGRGRPSRARRPTRTPSTSRVNNPNQLAHVARPRRARARARQVVAGGHQVGRAATSTSPPSSPGLQPGRRDRSSTRSSARSSPSSRSPTRPRRCAWANDTDYGLA